MTVMVTAKAMEKNQVTTTSTQENHSSARKALILIARKLTRSSSAKIRKSKHVLGTISDSDSEIDAVLGKKSSGGTGKRKPAAKGKSASLSKKNRSKESFVAPSQENDIIPPLEERKCPMAGCDSTGNVVQIFFKS